MAKTFCKSPPAPDRIETGIGVRTIWKQDWSYGTVGLDKTSVVEIVAIKHDVTACVNYEFSFNNCEKFLDDQLHLDCPLPSAPKALISGSISGGACIAYSIELSTRVWKIGLPSLFKPPSWLWPFPVPIKKPSEQMKAHEFVVSYDWDWDVGFDKLLSTPDCHAGRGGPKTTSSPVILSWTRMRRDSSWYRRTPSCGLRKLIRRFILAISLDSLWIQAQRLSLVLMEIVYQSAASI